VRHNRPVRPRHVVASTLVVAAFLAAGCSSERDAPDAPLAFCKAAAEYDHRLSTKQGDVPLRVQIALVADMASAAPPKIAPDANTFLDALQRVEDDPGIVDDPKIKRAVENVNRYAAQGCDFYARRSGGV
jgi:hypothetical protein